MFIKCCLFVLVVFIGFIYSFLFIFFCVFFVEVYLIASCMLPCLPVCVCVCVYICLVVVYGRGVISYCPVFLSYFIQLGFKAVYTGGVYNIST